jgi:hypothetical protein
MLTREECGKLDDQVVKVMVWLGTVRDRMTRRQEVGSGYDAACAAYNAVYDFHVVLMYAAMESGVAHSPEERKRLVTSGVEGVEG